MKFFVFAALTSVSTAFAPTCASVPRGLALRADKTDYASMDLPALENELRVARHRLLELRLEKQQQSKRANFKSSKVRELKAKISRVMPFYEAKSEVILSEEETAAASEEVSA